MPRSVGSFSLLLALCLSCFGQSKPALSQLSSPKPVPIRFLPGYVKLLDQLPSPGIAAQPLAQSLDRNNWLLTRRIPEASPRCGHIIIVPVTPEADPGMVLSLPRSSRDRMPTMKAMPPCEVPPR